MPDHAKKAADDQAASAFMNVLESYRREIVVALVLLVIAGGLYIFLRERQAEAEENAAVALYRAEVDAVARPDHALDAYAAVIKDHPGTRQRAVAYILDMAAARDNDDTDRAMASANAFLKDFPKHPLAGRVRYALANLYMNTGDLDRARREYDALKAARDEALDPLVFLASAQCRALEAERAADADEKARLFGEAAEEYRDIQYRGASGWPALVVTLARFGESLANDQQAGRVFSMPDVPGLPDFDLPLAIEGDADHDHGAEVPAATPAPSEDVAADGPLPVAGDDGDTAEAAEAPAAE